MFGNEVANTLIGGSGNDILVGGDSGDSLTGGVGTLDLASYENATKGVVADFANAANNTNDAKGDSYTTIEGLIGSAFDDTLRAELARSLLALSRQQVLQPTVTDINQLLSRMSGLLRRTLGEHVEINVVADDGLWTTIVDHAQLEAAILNLAVNARDAMPQG